MKIYSPNITGSLYVTGSNNVITGSLTVTQGITGSLFGTASYALSSNSASFAATSSYTTAISGTTYYLSKFLTGGTVGNSLIYDNGTSVGIGTTSPGYKLDISTTSGTSVFRTLDTTTSYKSFSIDYSSSFITQVNFGLLGRFEYEGNGGVLSIENRSTQAGSSMMRFVMGTTERMRITDTGNVGIGTTTPNSKLDVNGNTTLSGSLMVSQSLIQYSSVASVPSGSVVNVVSFNTGSYIATFFDYVTTSGTSARAGSIFTVWNGNNVEYAETSTNDIGNTSNLVLSASLSAGIIRLQATSLSGSWSVKTLARMI